MARLLFFLVVVEIFSRLVLFTAHNRMAIPYTNSHSGTGPIGARFFRRSLLHEQKDQKKKKKKQN